jgi:hypothetical protein
MITRRAAFAGAVAAAGVLALSAPGVPAATAPTCGKTDPKTGKTPRGTATLNEQSAVTDQAFKRESGHKTLLLSFNVGGCELAPDAPAPALEVNPRKGSDELPDSALTMKSSTPDGTTLDVKLDVNSAKFDPGSYGSVIVLRAPYMQTSRTPIAVSRSDNRVWVPALIGILAALGGLFLFNFAKKIGKSKLEVSRLALAGVAAIGAIAGAVAVLVNYYNQDVWTFSENWWSAVVTGFTGATTGVMAGLLGDIWSSEEAGDDEPEHRERRDAEEREPAHA